MKTVFFVYRTVNQIAVVEAGNEEEAIEEAEGLGNWDTTKEEYSVKKQEDAE